VPGYASEHAPPDLLTVMERKHEVLPSIARERSVGPTLPLQIQPILYNANSTALAFAEGHCLIRQQEERS
jgi:hypothetical protein